MITDPFWDFVSMLDWVPHGTYGALERTRLDKEETFVLLLKAQ